jgi:magnesium-transporting ATPase (P-type)
MGGATTVCSDKTGTLTQNRMTVHEGRILERYLQVDEAGNMTNKVEGGGPGFVVDANGTGADLANGALHHLFAGICVNSTAYRADDDATNLARDQADAAQGTKRDPTSEPKVSATKYVGNQTECALLQFADKCGQDYEHWRKQTETVKVYSFSSDRKRMSTVVKAQAGADKPYALYCKGAAEVVLEKCTSALLADNSVVSLDSDAGNGQTRRDVISAKLIAMNNRALRAICIAYRPCEDDRDWTLEANADMVCVGLIGILDPLRPEIRDAVAKCKTAGVVVRMVTGDSLAIAKNIAANCGIYDPEIDGEEAAMEGPTFRALSDRQMRKIAPKLRILARSSPTDKFKLVSVLQAMGDVVAVTGDGVNDGPALKKADVGFAMGLSGTDVAKEAADIVLLDDNFASIVNAIKWGRSVFDNIRKFLQFQLVVNFTAILVVFISVLADEKGGADNTPLKPVQLLWINLIMDSFAAVALATEQPTEELLRLKPYDRDEPLITRYMGRRMAMQVVLQTITFLVVLYSFEGILQTEKDQFDDPDLQFSTRHLTVVFNAFVLTQLVNQFNARKLRGEVNVFAGLQRHTIFIVVWIFAFTVQVLLVQFAGTSVETEALNGIQWAACLIIALLPLLWSLIFNLLPTRLTLSDWPWYDALMACLIPLICFCRKKGAEELIEDENDVSHTGHDQTAVEIGAPSEEEKKREAREAAASEGEAGDEVSALRSDLPPALGDSSNNRSSGSFHPGGAVHAARRLSSTDDAGEGLAGEEAAPDESDPAERWRRVMWATMTQVQVVSAFRRKHR